MFNLIIQFTFIRLFVKIKGFIVGIYSKAKHLLERFPAFRQYIMKLDTLLFDTKLYYNIHIRRKVPIIVFQMGKVASSSIYWSFPIGDYDFVITTHSMNPDYIAHVEKQSLEKNVPTRRNLYQGRSLNRFIAQPRRKARYISPVREPIGRNLSAFFQQFKLFVGVAYADSTHSTDELYQKFLEEFPHDLALNWFDQEYKTMLGIDIYQHPFPYDRGYCRIELAHADILLLRVELDNATKESAIADFLDLPDFKLSSANVGSKKEYADTYRQFKNQIVLPESYINRMLDSRFTQHFYSETEREEIRQQWMTRIP